MLPPRPAAPLVLLLDFFFEAGLLDAFWLKEDPVWLVEWPRELLDMGAWC